MCLPSCVPVCLPACVPVCLPVCLCLCLCALLCLYACACVPPVPNMPACLPACLSPRRAGSSSHRAGTDLPAYGHRLRGARATAPRWTANMGMGTAVLPVTGLRLWGLGAACARVRARACVRANAPKPPTAHLSQIHFPRSAIEPPNPQNGPVRRAGRATRTAHYLALQGALYGGWRCMPGWWPSE